jgi:hypothetical protein
VRGLNLSLAGLALLVWTASTFGHGLGLDLAREYFTWARTSGTLHDAGGVAGQQRGELILVGACVLPLLVGLGYLLWRVRHLSRARLLDAFVPWLLWVAIAALLWRSYMVYATELVHFVQYAIIGALLGAALGGGRRPQVAFLVAAGLGAADEVWQHWGLHVWLRQDQHHWLDWSDILLNAMGACGGILPFVTRARLRGEVLADTWRVLIRAVGIAALVLLPLLLLDPVDLTRLLGHTVHYPFWMELENHKAVHWPGPREGIPLLLGGLLVVGSLVESRRRALSQGSLLALVLLALVAVDPPSRAAGCPVHEVVPEVTVPRRDDAGIRIDGVLDEAAWQDAAQVWLERENVTGAPVASPVGRTGVRLLWNDRGLYLAFEVPDADVWARAAARDDPGLPADEMVQVLLDDGGEEMTFHEIDVSPAGVVYDAFVYIPASPHDFSPGAQFVGLPAWDARGLQTAARVDGTLDLVERWGPVPAPDVDQGYVVELLLPWEVFQTTTIPGPGSIRQGLMPRPGDRWRLGLHRVARPRPAAAAAGPGSSPPPAACRQRLSWSPTYLGQVQVPARFGVLCFGTGSATSSR